MPELQEVPGASEDTCRLTRYSPRVVIRCLSPRDLPLSPNSTVTFLSDNPPHNAQQDSDNPPTITYLSSHDHNQDNNHVPQHAQSDGPGSTVTDTAGRHMDLDNVQSESPSTVTCSRLSTRSLLHNTHGLQANNTIPLADHVDADVGFSTPASIVHSLSLRSESNSRASSIASSFDEDSKDTPLDGISFDFTPVCPSRKLPPPAHSERGTMVDRYTSPPVSPIVTRIKPKIRLPTPYKAAIKYNKKFTSKYSPRVVIRCLSPRDLPLSPNSTVTFLSDNPPHNAQQDSDNPPTITYLSSHDHNQDNNHVPQHAQSDGPGSTVTDTAGRHMDLDNVQSESPSTVTCSRLSTRSLLHNTHGLQANNTIPLADHVDADVGFSTPASIVHSLSLRSESNSRASSIASSFDEDSKDTPLDGMSFDFTPVCPSRKLPPPAHSERGTMVDRYTSPPVSPIVTRSNVKQFKPKIRLPTPYKAGGPYPMEACNGYSWGFNLQRNMWEAVQK
eukprot:g67806.t1